MIEQFKEQRQRFIIQAISDAKKWCLPPDSRVDKKRYSDQYWLKLFFTAAETVTHSNVHDFLVAFQLVRARNWDKQAVAERIVAFSSYEDSDTIDADGHLLKRREKAFGGLQRRYETRKHLRCTC